MADDNKPHPATPKKRGDFRNQGRFPRARDATFVAVIAAVLGVMVFYHGRMVEVADAAFRQCLGDLGAITRGDVSAVLATLSKTLLVLAAPQLFAAAIAGGAAGSLQAGVRLYPRLFQIRLDRFNPLPRLGELFNPKKAAFELAISVLRVGIVGAVCYQALAQDVPTMLGLTAAPLGDALWAVGIMHVKMILKVLGVLIVLAVIDFAYSRHRLEQSMRMSDQEVKEEQRQHDQDPKIKAKIKQKMRQVMRRRIIAATREADVVVTNPTHLAVALRYAESDLAPVVLAKGQDELALRMRDEARQHGIPIIENRPLARALYAEVEMGHVVPGAHYVAVAKVLAFVYQLQGGRRRPRATQRNARSRAAQRNLARVVQSPRSGSRSWSAPGPWKPSRSRRSG